MQRMLTRGTESATMCCLSDRRGQSACRRAYGTDIVDLLETEEYLEQQTDRLMERYASAEKNAVVLRDA